MKLLVFYLTDNRRHYTFQHFIKLINDSKYKNLWQLMVLTHTNDADFYMNTLKNYNLNYICKNVNENNNYLEKVNSACSYALECEIPYIMKCDNDIFIKSQTLDFIIENLNLLENNKHLTICPVLTSGIPGIEYFKEQFLDITSQQKLDTLFLNTKFYDRDGASYCFLNNHTIESNLWNKKEFFSSVKSMKHHYKGIHPIRINKEALDYLNNYIINNKNKFNSHYKLSIIDDDESPYLCNSIFAMKTDIYKNILSDTSLYVDPFDEVPLNKYAWNNNMNHLFVKNGFAIHMYYNWNDNHIYYEQDFCNRFFV